MKQHTPLVTLGMPVFNGENYLHAAIASLLAQTERDFELIISDNASADGTEDICREFVRNDARVRYERQPQNRGAVWNYNRLVEFARGKYFKWTAHDDIHGPTYLERCLVPLEQDPTVAWTHSRIAMIDERGDVLAGSINAFGGTGDLASRREHSLNEVTSPYTRHSRSSVRPSQRFDGIVLSSAWSLDCYGLMRTADLRRTRGFLATYGSERTLVAELGMLGRYVEIAEPLFFVRIHPQASGRHMTTAEQQAHVGPRRGSSWIHPRIQMFLDYCTVVARAPIGIQERALCSWTLFKYLMQFQKWRRVWRSLWRGTGVGGGNELFLPPNSTNAPQETCATTSSSGVS